MIVYDCLTWHLHFCIGPISAWSETIGRPIKPCPIMRWPITAEITSPKVGQKFDMWKYLYHVDDNRWQATIMYALQVCVLA